MAGRRRTWSAVSILTAAVLAACGGGGGQEAGREEAPGEQAPGEDAVDVTLQEYAFVMRGPLKAGGTFRLRNTGKEFHMMALGKLKSGKTLEDLKQALAQPPPPGPEGEQQDPSAEIVDEVGAPGTIIGPGQAAEVTSPALGAGRYALVCFFPVEGGGPPHFAQGMIGALTITDERAAEPVADVTSRIARGRPVEGPTTLSPGRHVLKFEAGEGGDELEPGLLELKPGKTVTDVIRTIKSFEQGNDFVLPAGAAAGFPAEVPAALLDFRAAKALYLGVDLSPGTYAVDAHDTDVDDEPENPVEQITITVR